MIDSHTVYIYIDHPQVFLHVGDALGVRDTLDALDSTGIIETLGVPDIPNAMVLGLSETWISGLVEGEMDGPNVGVVLGIVFVFMMGGISEGVTEGNQVGVAVGL